MASYLVTGGAGFIGSHLVEALLEKGHKVRVLDDFSTGRRENLEPFASRITLIEGSCAEPDIAREAVDGVDFVLHQAAIPSVPRSIQDPVASDRANCGGVVTMLHAAHQAGVKRFVMAGSSAVYGDTVELPKHEGMSLSPKSPYAVQKLAGEHYCRVFYETHGLPTVVLRYFNVFGPRQDPASEYAAVIPKFATAALQNTPATLFGDGEQTRDFTPVEGVVSANLLACATDKADGRVLNCARGDRISLNQLLDTFADLVGRPIERRHLDERPGDVKHSLADISLARKLLGYKPERSLKQALTRVLEYYENALEPARLRQ